MDDAIGSGNIVGSDDLGGIDRFAAVVFVGGQVEALVAAAEGLVVTTRPGMRPLGGTDAVGDNVEHEEGLEGLEVAGFEQEALEFGVQLALEGLIFRGEDGDVVVAHGLLEGLE